MVDKSLKEALALLKIVDAETDADERAALMEIARKTIRRVSLQYGGSGADHGSEANTDAWRNVARDTDGHADRHIEVNVTPVSHFCLRHG